jgi:single-strand DNA-binding protein
MAATVNKVILIGNLGDDIKMHYFDDSNSVGRFSMATSESYTNKKTGEKVTNTDWHNVVVRNKLAEICEKYLSKGDKVYVEGKLKNKQWEQDGIKRYSTEIHVSEMTFLSTKKNIENSTKSPEIKTVAEKNTLQNSATSEKKDDLPF